jgi:hypothetical protein
MSKEDWIWQAFPGHFCAAKDCLFRLSTVVSNGKYIVSTIGDYRPSYKEDNSREEIGLNRLFETMVFEAMLCDCGCGEYIATGSELDFRGYNDPISAKFSHIELCENWDMNNE